MRYHVWFNRVTGKEVLRMRYRVWFNGVAGLVVLLLAFVVTSCALGGTELEAVEREGGSTVEIPAEAGEPVPAVQTGLRGVLFNPNVKHRFSASYPWPVFDPYDEEYRAQIRSVLQDLSKDAHINFIDIFIPIPFTLADLPQGPQADQPLNEWANMTYLDNVAVFVDDCHDAGIFVELDLADNRWIPHAVNPDRHIGGQPGWPVADDTPWDESATWYSQIIEHVEARTNHPENIAMWCMMGHWEYGTAEPDLWGGGGADCLAYTEKFVKNVWPVFRAAGKRPKAAPIMLPIFSNSPGWATPESRLASFTNLKKWIVDDLDLPPDYWVMTTFPFCDPGPDGYYYLREIVRILGKENASRIISTDFKAIGIDFSRPGLDFPLCAQQGHSSVEMLEWNFQKCREYGFAGWWIYSYQDQEAFDYGTPQQTGIRRLDSEWKQDLLDAVRKQAQCK